MKRSHLVLGAVTVVVALGVALFVLRSPQEETLASESTLPSPVPSQATPSQIPDANSKGSRQNNGTSALIPTPRDLPTVESFSELDTEAAGVTSDLAEATVCGLRSSYFYSVVPRNGPTSQRIDAIREGLTTLDENLAEWYLATDLDARIAKGVALGRQAEYQWGKAVALADRGKESEARQAIAVGDRRLSELDAVNAAALCPR